VIEEKRGFVGLEEECAGVGQPEAQVVLFCVVEVKNEEHVHDVIAQEILEQQLGQEFALAFVASFEAGVGLVQLGSSLEGNPDREEIDE